MEGSLRYNFDHLDKSEDNEIIKVMQKIGLIILLKKIKMDEIKKYQKKVVI